MTPALLAVLSGAALTLLAVLAAVAALASGHRRSRHALEESRAQVAALRTRVEELETLRRTTTPPTARTEYVITTAPPPQTSPGPVAEVGPGAGPEASVSDRVVLSVALGEPLVKTVALVYGVRRALSAENRNRIVFEMRREVRRARKVRRRETREARRALHAAQRAKLGDPGDPGEPKQPGKPEQSGKPGKPGKPEQPGKPGEPREEDAA